MAKFNAKASASAVTKHGTGVASYAVFSLANNNPTVFTESIDRLIGRFGQLEERLSGGEIVGSPISPELNSTFFNTIKKGAKLGLHLDLQRQKYLYE